MLTSIFEIFAKYKSQAKELTGKFLIFTPNFLRETFTSLSKSYGYHSCLLTQFFKVLWRVVHHRHGFLSYIQSSGRFLSYYLQINFLKNILIFIKPNIFIIYNYKKKFIVVVIYYKKKINLDS